MENSGAGSNVLSRKLCEVYEKLRTHFGHQHWWPGETPFEVCVGAILTQNTSWTNVEKGIANLKRAGALSPAALHELCESELAHHLRPTGYFNVKARRLKSWIRVLVEDYNSELKRLFSGPTAIVRSRLLAINGIGPETADCMLLYAGQHLSFVVDAYTRRIFNRHAWCQNSISYQDLQGLCEKHLKPRPAKGLLDFWQDYHAQLVVTGKTYCHTHQPNCQQCPLHSLLPPDTRLAVNGAPKG